MKSWGPIRLVLFQILAGITFSFGDLVANSYASSNYGLSLLWTKLLALLLTIFLLQIAAQLGAFTGRGLIENIKHNYGVHASIICCSIIAVSNAASITAEVAVASTFLEFFTNLSNKFWAPLIALALCILAVKYSSNIIKIVISLMSFLMLLIVPVALSCKFGFNDLVRGFLVVSPISSKDWFITVLAMIGCVIGGYTIFFEVHEASESPNSMFELSSRYFGASIGSTLSFIIAVSIMIICYTQLYSMGVRVESINDILMFLIPKLGGFGVVLFVIGILTSFFLSISVIVISNFRLLEELVSDVAESVRVRYVILSGWKIILASVSVLLGAFLIILNVNVIKLSLYASALSTILLPIPLLFMARIFGGLKLPLNVGFKFLKFLCWFVIAIISVFSFSSIILAFI